ncbi:c-type cytochrome [Oceanisphaera sp. KMM 10153]|uniref:c-type cytochrome n=1 Tax=Oceanisphaera submarina TaxID=3390193 RepID=UPI003974EB74
MIDNTHMVKKLTAIGAVAFCGMAFAVPSDDESCQEREYCLGEIIDHDVYAAWDIDILPDGRGLPDGKGDVKSGKGVYETKCASCHGAGGSGGVRFNPEFASFPALATIENATPLTSTDGWPTKTIGTYWPYATTLFDYVRRAMPFTAPQSLTDDEVYSLTAYLLARNNIVPEEFVATRETVPAVRMPNVNGFVCDARPDSITERCMSNCAVPGEEGFVVKVPDNVSPALSDCMIYE